MPEFCRTERDGRIWTVVIDRPEVMNALHPPANIELGEAFDEFCADDDLWVAIITGAGDRAFSAGNDLPNPPCETVHRAEDLPSPRSGFAAVSRWGCAATVDKPKDLVIPKVFALFCMSER